MCRRIFFPCRCFLNYAVCHAVLTVDQAREAVAAAIAAAVCPDPTVTPKYARTSC